LAEDEAKDLAAGKNFSLDDTVSPSVLIAAGLDLEGEQYVSYSWHFYTLTYLTQTLISNCREASMGTCPGSPANKVPTA